MSWFDDLFLWFQDNIFDRDAVNDGLADHGYFDEEEEGENILDDDIAEDSW